MAIHMTSQHSTEELVERARTGDREAFDEIQLRYQGRLEQQIRARIGAKLRARLEVEDLVQETFAAAFESIARLVWKGEEAFYRWLSGIAEHRIRSVSRQKAWDVVRLQDAAAEVASDSASPTKRLRRSERFDRLEKALGGLSDEHREVLILSRVEGLKLKEVAARMNRSPEAVRKLLARALLRLKESFGDTESLHLPDRPLQSGTEEKDA
jgi:RNA polymerase sigma-70 factor (ECF subfamily)